MAAILESRRFTVDDYHRMAEAGILTEDDRVELIDGQIIQMSPIGDAHMASVNRCTRTFSQVVGVRVLVSVQNPIKLDQFNEPQPDIALLRPRIDDYARGKPGPADVLLVVEVADTSLDADRRVKLPRYAAAGISETWLLDLEGDALEVHRQPSPRGYRLIQRLGRGDRVAPQAFSDLEIAVDALLPPVEEPASDQDIEGIQGNG